MTGILVIASAGMAGAQEAAAVEEPPELAEYRDAFESQLEERTKPLTESYARSLGRLENIRAIREDYEGALRAKRRRLQLQSDGSGEVSQTENKEVEGTIVLRLNKARLSGSTVLYDDKRGALTGFRRPRHSATWEVMKSEPGWYKVIATYGCAESYTEKIDKKNRSEDEPSTREMVAGGKFMFFEDTNLIKDVSPPIIKTVVPTGGWDKLVTHNIGKLKLTGTTTTLKLEAIETGNLGIMYLRELKLVPDAAPGTTLALDEDPNAPAGLRELRAQYRTQVEQELKDSIESYVVELKLMEDRFTEAAKLEEAVAVRTERARAEVLREDPARVIESP